MAASGGCAGSVKRSTTPITPIRPAATKNMVRQPRCVPTKPAAVRDRRMPMSSPLITVPTTRPRSEGAASCAAKGMSSCGTTVVTPMAKLAATITSRLGASPAATSATPTQPHSTRMTLRRSRLSPSGTRNSMPTA